MLALKLPAAHALAPVAPTVLTKVPAGAVVQAVLPVVLVKVPMAHCVALVAATPATKLPAGAGVQGVLPVAEKLPAVQATNPLTVMPLSVKSWVLPPVTTLFQ